MLERTVVLRERILQVLRDADEPLATMEVVRRIGKIEHREAPAPLRNPHDPSDWPWSKEWEVIECPVVTGEWVWLRPTQHHDVYPNLRALAKLGRCWQLGTEDRTNQTTYWTVVPPA